MERNPGKKTVNPSPLRTFATKIHRGEGNVNAKLGYFDDFRQNSTKKFKKHVCGFGFRNAPTET
ncbi:MAG: hypothetical protein ACOC98_12750, partial [Thermodesulfobacteriota bacterium]